MRFFIVLLMLVVAPVASADECSAVEEHSYGHIKCIKDDFGYTLLYDSWISRNITLASGQYDDMIATLCVAGGVVRETWKPPFKATQIRTTTCAAGD